MKYAVWSIVIVALLGAAVAYAFEAGELITLHVEEPGEGERIWPIRKSPFKPPTGSNVLQALRVGDQVQVDGCENTKSDVVIRLRTNSGEIGYDGHGSYSLERRPVTLRILLSNPRRIVFSCRGWFENRNRLSAADEAQ